MPPIIPLADALTHLGVTAATADATKVERLLDSISAEMRRITNRGFEGTPTVYDELLAVDEAATLVLPRSPVLEVIAVRPTYFDGLEDAVLEPRVVVDGASTTAAAAVAIGATNVKLDDVTDLLAGTRLAVGSASALEVVRVTNVGTAGAAGAGVDFEPAFRYAHALGAAVVEVAGSPYWLLELPRRGRIRLARRMEYGRFTYLVSGEIPVDVVAAAYDWLTTEWAAQQPADLDPLTREKTSESHDSWSESYAPTDEDEVAGGTFGGALVSRLPPPSVTRVLAGYYHPRGGGPV